MRLRIVCICVAALVWARGRSADRANRVEPFVTAAQCIACHAQLTAPSGEDVSIGFDWRASMMANSARDPYWQAAVRREVIDHPTAQAAIEDKCSTCHMPMARFDAAAAGGQGQVFANLAPRRRSTRSRPTACRAPCAIRSRPRTRASTRASTAASRSQPHGGAPRRVRAARRRRGPASRHALGDDVHADRGDAHPAIGALRDLPHALSRQRSTPPGQAIGTLPEQVPYQEWLHSELSRRRELPELPHARGRRRRRRSPRCSASRGRGCRSTRSSARNAFMLRHAEPLSRRARRRRRCRRSSTPRSHETRRILARERRRWRSRSAAAHGRRLDVDVDVTSTTGHKLPTAYPSRRAWLHVAVTMRRGASCSSRAPCSPDGSIVGNDNDADARAFRAALSEIDERRTRCRSTSRSWSIATTRVTTGLLRGVRYVKDNRLLPRGFDKAHGRARRRRAGRGCDRRRFRRRRRPRALPHRARRGGASAPLDASTPSCSINRSAIAGPRICAATTRTETQRFARYYAETAAVSATSLRAQPSAVVPTR